MTANNTILMNTFNDYIIFGQMVKNCGDTIDCQAGVHDLFLEILDDGNDWELPAPVATLLQWLNDNDYHVADARVYVSFQSDDF